MNPVHNITPHFFEIHLNININIFWDARPYSLVDIYQRFGGTCSFHLQDAWKRRPVIQGREDKGWEGLTEPVRAV
jgi:hypothetical protein